MSPNGRILRALPALLLTPCVLATCFLAACGPDAASTAPPPAVPQTGTDSPRPIRTTGLDETRFVPCDVATWFLYHPADLAHRAEAPELWWMEEFTVERELAAGRLVVVGTGSDGNCGVRFTDGGLSERERTYALEPSARFRLRVSRGRLFLGNGDALPCVDPLEDPAGDPDGWFDVPPGDYAVTVHRIAWDDEPGAVDADGNSTPSALTAFVAEFDPVEDLATITPHTFIPRVDGGAVDADRADAATTAREDGVDGDFVVWITDDPVYPGVELELPVRAATADLAMDQDEWGLLVTPKAEEGALAALFRFSTVDSRSEWSIAVGRTTQFVRITSVVERDGATWAHAVGIAEGPAVVAPERLTTLKTRFAEFASTDAGYRKRTRHPRFAAERVAASMDPSDVAFGIASLLDLSAAERADLTDADNAAGRLDVVERALASRTGSPR